MLKTLESLLDRLRPVPAAAAETPGHVLQLATAVMLVEVMRADAELDDRERVQVVAGLRAAFALSDAELEQLVTLAGDASRQATDLFRFTAAINERFELLQKVQMIESMWRVAYADGALAAHENHLMRRASDLLHIPHGAYVNAKLRARAAVGGDGA